MKINHNSMYCFIYVFFNTNLGSFMLGKRDIWPENIVGVHLSSKFNFDMHISKPCQKAGDQIKDRLQHLSYLRKWQLLTFKINTNI
jgi:hypothetical protein